MKMLQKKTKKKQKAWIKFYITVALPVSNYL